ncbi:hypothetical protein CTI12_AA055790 [Artemisia annua]|uniref:Uncharacterized protein n=1 Tax=Artemisia annua TaxID=35608 RepID=A0A2U1Q9Z7_ARTAN|nr:hypothetical protein CTI12_AA055790 [Artemisia annua]
MVTHVQYCQLGFATRDMRWTNSCSPRFMNEQANRTYNNQKPQAKRMKQCQQQLHNKRLPNLKTNELPRRARNQSMTSRRQQVALTGSNITYNK